MLRNTSHCFIKTRGLNPVYSAVQNGGNEGSHPGHRNLGDAKFILQASLLAYYQKKIWGGKGAGTPN